MPRPLPLLSAPAQQAARLRALQHAAPGAARCGVGGAYRSCVAAAAGRAQGGGSEPTASQERPKRDRKAADRTAEWREPHTGIPPYTLDAIRAEDDALRGMPESEWLRREAAVKRGDRPSRPLSAEHKQKISAAQKGRAVNGHVMTPDHKAAISRGMRWMHANPEHKAKRLAGAGKRIMTCSRCREAGHNVRTCTQPPPQADARPQREVFVPEILE